MSNFGRDDRYRAPPLGRVSTLPRKPPNTPAIGNLTVTCPVCSKGCQVWGNPGQYKIKEHGNPATNEICAGTGTEISGVKKDSS